jgi:hypothetical protein
VCLPLAEERSLQAARSNGLAREAAGLLGEEAAARSGCAAVPERGSHSGLQFGRPISLNGVERLLIKSCTGVHQFMVLAWLNITANCYTGGLLKWEKSLIAYQKG